VNHEIAGFRPLDSLAKRPLGSFVPKWQSDGAPPRIDQTRG
jgi:hypothetical protein